MEPTQPRRFFSSWRPYGVILVVLLVVGGSLAAYVYIQEQTYYPVVRVDIPGPMTVTAVLNQAKDREACKRANDRFLTPFKTRCKDCTITVARCARELEGFELTLHDGGPVPYPVVVSRGARVAFMGSTEIANQQCQQAAAFMLANGAKSAACVPAGTASKK